MRAWGHPLPGILPEAPCKYGLVFSVSPVLAMLTACPTGGQCLGTDPSSNQLTLVDCSTGVPSALFMEGYDPLSGTAGYNVTAPMASYIANGTQFQRFWYDAPPQHPAPLHCTCLSSPP
jgi:hypothetical protein